jgi:hypothetical protein
VLKVGGKVIVSDVLARKELSEEMKMNAALLVGCVAGAALVEDVEKWMREARLEGECPDFYLGLFSWSNCVKWELLLFLVLAVCKLGYNGWKKLEITLQDTHNDLNIYNDACCTQPASSIIVDITPSNYVAAKEKANEKGEGSGASCGCSAASTKMDLNEWVGEREFSLFHLYTGWLRYLCVGSFLIRGVKK